MRVALKENQRKRVTEPLLQFLSLDSKLSLSPQRGGRSSKRTARAGGITNAVNVGIAVQADWENQSTTKSKLISLSEKLDTLERCLELLEVQVLLQLTHLCLTPDRLLDHATSENN